MSLLGIGLATLNVVSTRHDLSMATGPKGQAQREWFIDASERPDIAAFFKKLSHVDRLKMSKAIGRYDDAALAKLVGKLLADFDADARRELTHSLLPIAAAHPEAVANQFTQKGSFQTLGISTALRPQGAKVLPAVADMLANGDARPAASAYLVGSGDAAIDVLIAKLNDASDDVKLAAADALGQLRAKRALPRLLRLLEEGKPEQRPLYLAAIGAIGDPSSEQFLAKILADSSLPVSERTPVALGLGRIGGTSEVPLLWRYAQSDDPALATAAQSALSTIGPSALLARDVSPPVLVSVASAMRSPDGDDAIRNALDVPSTRIVAVKAAAGRQALLPKLVSLISAAQRDGDLAEPLVDVLSQTAEGRQALVPYRSDPALAGFIERAAR
jgi:hypothetical protein